MLGESTELAQLELKGLKQNLLLIKNELLDQASFNALISKKDKRISILEYQNKQLISDYKETQSKQVKLPMIVTILQQKIQKLQTELDGQKFLSEQLQALENTTFSNEKTLQKSVRSAKKRCKKLEGTVKSLEAVIEAKNQEITVLRQHSLRR